jgi:uncharacterized protein (DUF1778 family)
MKQNTGSSKAARFEARITEDQKAIFQRAAILGGHRSLTEFVIQSAQEKADALIRDHEVLNLTAKDKRIFVEALLKPPVPGKKLKRAAERYKNMESRK